MPFIRKFGPGLLVTAAFVGPGTITTASMAGASFGFALLWTLVFAVFATIILQEMAARLGLVTRNGLGEAIRDSLQHPLARVLACGLVVLAIGFGNAAYQTGNITGAAAALELLLGCSLKVWAIVVGGVAAALLATGTYRIIERVLIALVVLMSVVFLVTAVAARPDVSQILAGMCRPSLPDGSALTAIALIGTTVVPYNLFLHASSARQKWDGVQTEEALSQSRVDTALAVALGGLVTFAIMTTAASAANQSAEISKAADIAKQLEPLLGQSLAKIWFAAGLFAAGLTSAVTAPLAAAYATAGILGWRQDLRSARFRSVWVSVLAAGTIAAATLGKSPAETIVLAQVANGLLLPLTSVFLLVAVNRRELMGKYVNNRLGNLLGVGIVAFATGLGLFKVLRECGLF